MDGQVDGRAVARALRGLPDAVPVTGHLSMMLQQLVDTAGTVLVGDGVGLMLADEDGHPRTVVTTDAVAELLERCRRTSGKAPA